MIVVQNEARNITAVIACAGKGTRMLPLTKYYPKCLLYFLNKPILEHILENFIAVGVKRFIIIINPEKKDFFLEFRQFFLAKYDNSIVIDFKIQEEPLGFGHALKIGLSHAIEQSEKMILLAGDNLFPAEFIKKMIKEHYNAESFLTIALKKVSLEEIHELSTVELDSENRIKQIIEKPKPEEILSSISACAFYIVNKTFMKYMKWLKKTNRGEYEIQTVFSKVIAEEKNVIGCIAKKWYHFSHITDLFGNNMNALQQHTAPPHILVAKDAQISKNAILEENVIIGSQAIVPADCRLKNVIVFPKTNLSRFKKLWEQRIFYLDEKSITQQLKVD